MKYGLPYKGSKNKLAERIVRLLPQRENLIDLFCGGCAVSHAALLQGKYKHIHINDLNWMCTDLFLNALRGKYTDERRWISREDFYHLKDTDPYVAVVWSFGNNMRDYMYSPAIEPLKRAIHYALFFADYEPGKALGYDLSFIDGVNDTQRRYALIRHYFKNIGEGRNYSGAAYGSGAANCKRPWEMEYAERAKRLASLQKKNAHAPHCENAERLSRLVSLAASGTTTQCRPAPATRGGARNIAHHKQRRRLRRSAHTAG